MILTERQSVFSHDHMTVLEKLQHQRRRRKKKNPKTLQRRQTCMKTFIWVIIVSLAGVKSKIRRKQSEYFSKILKYLKENEAMTRKRRAISQPDDS